MSGVSMAGRPVPVLAAAVTVCAAIVMGGLALAPLLLGAFGDWSPPLKDALFTLLLFGVLGAAGLIGRRLARVERPARSRAAAWVALGAAMGVGGLVLALADATLAGTVSRGMPAGAAGALLLGSGVTLAQSTSEEVFFRGWLQPVLQRAWGPAAAIGVTAVAFAALHVAGGARTVLELVNTALAGALFGLLAWRSGGIAASVAAHAGWNWSEGILFGLDPNPGIGSFGAIHDLEMTGAALWGGSDHGLNASIAVTLVLAALALPLLVARGASPPSIARG